MPEEPRQTASAREPAGTRARRLALAILFTVILLIPRLRRLRRRPRAWLAVRIIAGAAGALFIWRFARAGAGLLSLISGVVLAALAGLVGARPEKRTVDDVARELDALVVINGGDFPAGGGPHRGVSIFVHPERLLVLTRSFETLAEIPLAALRQVSTAPAAANGLRGGEAWELRIDWESGGPQAASFRYEGAFAEHLARVAAQTINSVWKKNLPVLPA
jgi:hypothetical protein